MIGPRKLIYCNSRRRLLKGAVGLAGLYVLSKIPISYAENKTSQTITAPTEIDVGTLQVPVTLDGHVEKEEWYNDSIPYESNFVAGIVKNPHPYQFIFRTKSNEYTYEAIDAPDQGLPASIFIDFDTKSAGSGKVAADGLYVLWLDSNGGWHERDPNINGSQDNGIGFLEAGFKRGQDYDWRVFMGPSPLDPKDHMQAESWFLTDILTKNAKINSDGNKQINYYTSIVNSNGTAQISSGNYIPMIFKAQPLPEFDDEAAILLTSLVGAAAATKLARRPMSRRNFLGISTLERSKKHGRHDESRPSRGSGFNL